MNSLRRILKNAFFLAGTNGVNLIAAFAFAAMTSRYLGQAGFGNMMIVFSVATFLEGIVRGSANMVLTQRIAQNPENAARYWWPATVIYAGFGAFFIAGGILGAWLLHSDREVFIGSAFAAWITIGRIVTDGAISVQRGSDQMGPEFWTTLMERGLYLLALGALFVRFSRPEEISSWGFYGIFAANVLTQWLQAALLIFPLWSKIRPTPFVDRTYLADLFHASSPLWICGLLAMCHLRSSIFLLKHFSTEEAVGVYTAAYKLMDAVRIIPWFLCMAIFPTLSRHVNDTTDGFKSAYAFSLKILTLISVPFAASLFLISGPLVRSLYPPSFQGAIAPLQWMSAAVIPVFLNGLFGYGIIVREKQSLMVKTYAAAVAVQIAACCIFIPRYDVMGATYGYFLGECGLLVFTLAATTQEICPLRFRNYAGSTLCILTAGGAIAAFYHRSLWLAAAAGSVAFAASLLLFPVFSGQERKRICEMLSPKKAEAR
jgi:O-antigen/teichoic acid export membrane protein